MKRRDFLKGGVGVVAAGVSSPALAQEFISPRALELVRLHWCFAKPRLRRNIYSLYNSNPNHPTIQAYRTAVSVMKGRSVNDPTSWLYQANIHGTNIAPGNRSLSVLEALTNAPEQMRNELDLPFTDRVLAPLLGRVQGLTRRLTPADSGERIRAKLDLAGNPAGMTVERVNGLKVLGFGGALVVSLVISIVIGLSLMFTMAFVMAASLAGYLAPNMYLYQRTYDRSDKLRKALPDAIDLLTISVESGLGFDAAVSQVARNTAGPLADEFARMLQEMQIGLEPDRRAALAGRADEPARPPRSS